MLFKATKPKRKKKKEKYQNVYSDLDPDDLKAQTFSLFTKLLFDFIKLLMWIQYITAKSLEQKCDQVASGGIGSRFLVTHLCPS